MAPVTSRVNKAIESVDNWKYLSRNLFIHSSSSYVRSKTIFDSEILLKLCYKEITYYTNLERKNIVKRAVEASAK